MATKPMLKKVFILSAKSLVHLQLQILVRDRALAGAAEVGGEFAEHAARLMWFACSARVHPKAPLGAESM